MAKKDVVLYSIGYVWMCPNCVLEFDEEDATMDSVTCTCCNEEFNVIRHKD